MGSRVEQYLVWVVPVEAGEKEEKEEKEREREGEREGGGGKEGEREGERERGEGGRDRQDHLDITSLEVSSTYWLFLLLWRLFWCGRLVSCHNMKVSGTAALRVLQFIITIHKSY